MMGLWGKKGQQDMAQTRDRVIAALDVGTSKVAALIAQVPADGSEPKVLGVGHQLCTGLSKGMVNNMEQTEKAVRAVMDQAEKAANRSVEGVYLGISSASLHSEVVSVDVEIGGHAVEQADLTRVLSEGRQAIDSGSRMVLHAEPACYSIDGAHGIINPRGMYGDKLGVDIHVVTAEHGPVKNLDTCVRRAHLDVHGVVAAPVAAGNAVLSYDERDLGVALIELGAGVTNIAVYAGGRTVGCATVLGGQVDVTTDIARTLMTPPHHAERLKTLFGTVLTAPTDNHEMIDVIPASSEEGTEFYRVSRAQLAGIIRQRQERLFSEIAQRLDELGFRGQGAQQVVLTGGGSQLPGIAHFAQALLGKSVRVGRPMGLRGLPDAAAGPAFATLGGLIHTALRTTEDARYFAEDTRIELPRGRLARMGRWIKATF
jgi:cell division protein FtsA